MPRSLTVISTEQNTSTYQLFTPQWETETMLTCRQLACFTSSKYPADLFVQSKNKKNWSNQNGKLKRRVKTPLGNTPLYFASYFFATLSSEVVGGGRRHVCVWADRVRAFLWTSRSLSLSLSQTGTAQRKGNAANKPPLQLTARASALANKEPLLVNPFKVKDFEMIFNFLMQFTLHVCILYKLIFCQLGGT